MNGFTRACALMLLLVLSALVPTAATAGRGVTCDDVINALEECNGGYACDDDLGDYFPGATRGALVAAESAPWFTRDAFDRHCLAICKAGTVDWEARDAEFKRDICGVGKPAPAKPVRPLGYVETYTLRGRVKLDAGEVPLWKIIAVAGTPKKKGYTPYECGSAFSGHTDNPTVYEYRWPDFTIETDGRTAVIRSIRLVGGNEAWLPDGRAASDYDRKTFGKTFEVDKIDDGYRASNIPGVWEATSDFEYNASGRPVEVRYWIAC